MNNNFWLVYKDTEDNYPVGIIIGSEDDARKYCYDHNVKCKYRWEEFGFEEIEVLNKPVNRELYETVIELGECYIIPKNGVWEVNGVDVHKAIENQIPKKMERYQCPECRHYFEDGEQHRYCPCCGQKLTI